MTGRVEAGVQSRGFTQQRLDSKLWASIDKTEHRDKSYEECGLLCVKADCNSFQHTAEWVCLLGRVSWAARLLLF